MTNPRLNIPRMPWPLALAYAIAWAYAVSHVLAGCQ